MPILEPGARKHDLVETQVLGREVSHPAPIAVSEPAVTRALDPIALYRQHAPFVWRNLRRLGVLESSIDDALQDVFLVVHRKLPGFDARSSVKTWLFGIVLRIADRHRRSARRQNRIIVPASSVLLDSVATSADDQLEIVAQRQAVQLLEQLLEDLDRDKRAMLVMVELEQMSVVEAAEALNLNLNTAYARLRAARTAFERALTGHRSRQKDLPQ